MVYFFNSVKRWRGKYLYLRPLENEDMPFCLFSSIFPELFLFNPRSSQRKSKSPRKVASDRPLQTTCSTRAATGKRVAYTVVLGSGLGELSYCCPPSRWVPRNHITSVHWVGKWKFAEFCCHVKLVIRLTPLQILGGMDIMTKRKGIPLIYLPI